MQVFPPPHPAARYKSIPVPTFQAGRIGSHTLVKTTGNVLINGGIHSGRTISLATNNTVTGNITAANAGNASGNIMSAGSSTVIPAISTSTQHYDLRWQREWSGYPSFR